MFFNLFLFFSFVFGMWGTTTILQGLYILFSIYAVFYGMYVYKKNLQIRISVFQTKQSVCLRKYILIFLVFSSLYVLLSFLNFPKVHNIRYLDFENRFVFRHFFVVYSVFLSISIAFSLYKKNVIILEKNIYVYVFLILCGVGTYMSSYPHILQALGIQALTLIVLRNNKKILLLFIPLFFFGANSSYAIAACFIILCCLIPKIIENYLKSHIGLKVLMTLSFLFFFCIIFSSFMMEKINGDPNALWRLMVWQDEVNSLLKTNFLGVGFGSAYVTDNIFFAVDNSHMYDEDFATFLVANHNSILNMFYRMGLVGGLIFCMIIVSTLVWFSKIYHRKQLDSLSKKYVYWALINWLYNLIIITLNPGLESPRFATSYLISLGCLWGMLLYFQEKIGLTDSFSD